MKTMKRWLSLLLSLAMLFSLVPLPAHVHAAEEDGGAAPQTEILISEGKCGQGVANEMISVEDDNARYRIYDTDADGIGDKMVISGSGDTYDYAWNKYLVQIDPAVADVTTLIIEEGIATIGSYLMYKAENLTTVYIPNSLVSLDHCAFCDCSNLSDLVFSDAPALCVLGSNSFSNCSSLADAELLALRTLRIIESEALADTGYDPVILPPDVTDVDGECMSSAEKILYVPQQALPADVSDWYCGVVIGYELDEEAGEATITSIYSKYSDYFKNGISLPEIFGCTVTRVNQFHNKIQILCPGHKMEHGICVLCGYTDLSGETFTGYCGAEEDGKNLTWTVSGGVLTIAGEGEMFQWDSNKYQEIPWHTYKDYIQKIVIEEGVTTLGPASFVFLKNVTEVQIADSVERMGQHVFNQCTNLKTITIPEKVTEIPGYAFYKCNKLESIIIEGPVTAVGDYAFQFCSRLADCDLPDTVEMIGHFAFSQCNALKSFTIGKNVEWIGNYAFSKCKSLEQIIWLSRSVVTIGDYMLSGESDPSNIDLLLTGKRVSGMTDAVTWNGYTFKSIQILCEDDTLDHAAAYTDNGDGTHHLDCSRCGYAGDLIHYHQFEMDADSHTDSCMLCGYEATDSHVFGDDSTCDVCGMVCEEHRMGDWKRLYDGVHARTCSICNFREMENCSGDPANCSYKAYCTTCETFFGELDPTVHANNGNSIRFTYVDSVYHLAYYQCCGVEKGVLPHVVRDGYEAYCGDWGYCRDCRQAFVEPDPRVHRNIGENGICNDCGDYQPAEQINGVYQIANAGNFFWFAQQVNAGEAAADAVVVADIDLEGREWIPLGTQSAPYIGSFDGQNHTISNFKMTITEGGFYGLFGCIRDSRVVNFSISGEMVIDQPEQLELYCGVIGKAAATNGDCTVENIHSAVNVTILDSFNKNCVAGVIGNGEGKSSSPWYRLYIRRCTYSGTMDFGGAYVDCGGGIMGYGNYNGAIYINQCLFSGEIRSASTAGGQVGGIMGYNRGTNLKIENCLSLGRMQMANAGFTGALAGRYLISNGENFFSNNKAYNNCYAGDVVPFSNNTDSSASYSNIDIVDFAQYESSRDAIALHVTDAQLASGEVAYRLGGSWGQTIGTDAHPVLNGRKVYQVTNCKNEFDHYSNDASAPAVHNFGGGIACDDCGYVCPHTAFADGSCLCGEIAGGYCGAEEGGKNLTWTLIDGVLTIKGEGAMMDYDDDMPSWDGMYDQIQSIVIEDGVTTIGNYALSLCDMMTDVRIPDSVTSIGVGAFGLCSRLEKITIPEQVTEIPKQAFFQCDSLETVIFDGNITTIGEEAFYDCMALNSIIFPDSLETIGEYAFYQCTNMTEVTIPDNVKSIGMLAFSTCLSLKNLTIGRGVTEIGDEAFSYCAALENLTWLAEGEVTLGKNVFYTYSNRVFSSYTENVDLQLARGCADQVTDSVVWNGYTFKSIQILCEDGTLNHSACTDNGDGTHHVDCDLCGYAADEVHGFCGGSTCDGCGYVCYHTTFTDGKCPCGRTGGYCGAEEDGKNLIWTLADGVLTISGEGAMYEYNVATDVPWFNSSNEINSVAISNGVISISQFAFATCKSLTEVCIPESVERIGRSAFNQCAKLESITLPEKVTEIPAMAFYKCTMLKNVTMEGKITSIGERAFHLCSSLENITIPDTVETIGVRAFYQCGDLSEITIPDNVTLIDAHAFNECTSLEFVTIGKNVTRIGESAFYNCVALKNLTCLAEGELVVADAAFGGNNYTENVTLTLTPASVGQMTDDVTWNGYKFKSIQILCEDDTLNHSIAYTDNGDGTHHVDCDLCGYVDDVPHSYTDGLCVCGNTQLTITRQPASFEGLVGDMATFTVEAEGKGLTYQWYFSKDGGETWEKSSCTKNTLSVEFKAYRLNYQYRCEITDADGDILVSDAAVLAAQEMDIVILTQPVSYVGAVNDEVTFTVEATGNGLTYEWFFSTNYGETWAKSYSPGYMTNTLSPILRNHRDENMYKCVITDVLGNSVESEAVSMTVETSKIIIVKQPVGVENAVLGQLYGFSVEAEGVNLTYRWEFSADGGETWQESWNQGYNTANLSVRMNANRDGNMYRCVITSGRKVIVTSEAAVLDMQDPSVELIGQSDSIYITANETATFTVEAEGTDLTYLWYRSDDKGANWYQTYLSGYNTNTLSFVGTVGRAAMYMCKITDGSGKAIWSEPVKLQVLSAELKILTQPVSTTGAVGETVSFTVEAQGDGLTYQWQVSTDGENWTPSFLGGYNSKTFSFEVDANRAGKVYKCVITDAAGNTVATDVVSAILV